MTKEMSRGPAQGPRLRLPGDGRPRRPERAHALRHLGRRRLGRREHVLCRRHGHHEPVPAAREQGVAFEFVDEVQVKASGYQAEYGGSLGGVINVITRQGGNAFHGEVLGYYSGSRLNGKERDTLRLNPYDVNTAEYVNYQDLYGKDQVDRFEAGFNLGGYVLKDKLWFLRLLPAGLPETTRHVDFDPSADRRGLHRARPPPGTSRRS